MSSADTPTGIFLSTWPEPGSTIATASSDSRPTKRTYPDGSPDVVPASGSGAAAGSCAPIGAVGARSRAAQAASAYLQRSVMTIPPMRGELGGHARGRSVRADAYSPTILAGTGFRGIGRNAETVRSPPA